MTEAFDLLTEARWEMEGTRRAQTRYREAAAVADPATLPSGQKLLREIVPPLTARIKALQDEGMEAARGRGNPCLWAAPIQLLEAEILAVITVTRSLHGAEMAMARSFTTQLSDDISQAVQAEIEYRTWVSAQVVASKAAKEAKDWTHVNLAEAFKKRHPTADSRSWKRFSARLGAARQPWDHHVSMQVGSALIQALLDAAPGHFTLDISNRGGMRTQRRLRLSEETQRVLRDIEVRAEVARPMLLPMLIPPIPWCRIRSLIERETDSYSGGYVIHRKPAIRTSMNTHTLGLDAPLSNADLAAMNAVQATPWRINRWLYDVMEEAWANGQRVGGLEVNEPLEIPRLEADAWDALSDAARSAHKALRMERHVENDAIMGRSRAVMDALSVANELRDKPEIYYPHSKDWRGRLYPLATFGPHPQGADIQKALLMFAEGVPLGDDGLYWLLVRAANAAGQDKLSLEDRVRWSLDHQRQIEASAKDPLTFTWWADIAEKDEPWNLLATCYELASALSMSKPAEFVSHLPIPLDGSCNGLQHLAAMGLDPVGALATNLTNAPAREDIYEAVAMKVRARVEQDVVDGVDMARVWYGRVSRSAVKRAVMTTPYGVTDRGIRDQLLLDGHVPAEKGLPRGAAADYLRDCLVAALSDTVQSARSIMAWLQTTSDRLARAGVAFDWSTPTGARVRQAYHEHTRVRLRTLVGDLILWDENPSATLSIRKQALGSAPNVIHSFDAAHLTMTVNAGAANGITSWAMIHDSYGTHAGLTTRLAGLLREQFVIIYKQDWLTMIKEDIAAYAPHVVVDDPPARGSFDIEQVRHASYFFS